MAKTRIEAVSPSPRALTKKLLRIMGLFAFLMLFIVWIVVPMAYSVLWSLVDPSTGWNYPDLLPKRLSFENWRFVLENANIAAPIFNSFFIAIMTSVLSFVLAAPTAYAIGRRNIKGKGILKTLMLLPLILPGMTMSIYVGRVLYAMGLVGTYTGVIMGHMLGGIPYMLRILTVSFESMPQDILDAASNLGAGPWVRFKEVYVPMLMPSIVSASIFTFINSMENFTTTFIIGLPSIKTIPTVLFSYLGESFSATRASVVSLLLLIPNLVLLIIVERCIKTEYMGAALGKM